MQILPVIAIATALVVSGCSASGEQAATSTPTGPASAAPTASTTPTSSASPTQDPAEWAPLQVSPAVDGGVVQIVKGQRIEFTDLPKKVKEPNLQTSNPAILELGEQGDVLTATATGLGATRVVMWNGFPADGPAKQVFQVVFQIVDLQGTDAPGQRAPIVIDADTTEASAVPGMTIVFAALPLDKATYKSSDENVIFFPAQPETNGNPFAIAVGEGAAIVRIKNPKGKVKTKVTFTVANDTAATTPSPANESTESPTPTAVPTN